MDPLDKHLLIQQAISLFDLLPCRTIELRIAGDWLEDHGLHSFTADVVRNGRWSFIRGLCTPHFISNYDFCSRGHGHGDGFGFGLGFGDGGGDGYGDGDGDGYGDGRGSLHSEGFGSGFGDGHANGGGYGYGRGIGYGYGYGRGEGANSGVYQDKSGQMSADGYNCIYWDG